MRERDTRNQGISQLAGPALFLPRGHQLGRPPGSQVIERRNPAAYGFESSFQSIQQKISASAGRHDLQSKAYLKHSDGIRPYGSGWLAVEPLKHPMIRALAH